MLTIFVIAIHIAFFYAKPPKPESVKCYKGKVIVADQMHEGIYTQKRGYSCHMNDKKQMIILRNEE